MNTDASKKPEESSDYFTAPIHNAVKYLGNGTISLTIYVSTPMRDLTHAPFPAAIWNSRKEPTWTSTWTFIWASRDSLATTAVRASTPDTI